MSGTERRKTPRTPNAKGFDLTGALPYRPRNDVQGQQGPEHFPASRNHSRWLGSWLLAPASDSTPQRPNHTKRKMTVDARLRVAVLGFALAAIVVSTNALGSIAEVGGSIASRVKASILIAKKSVNVETLAPLLEIKPQDDWGNTSASSVSSKRADTRSCVRSEVYRTAPDLNRFWWLLRDPNGRTIKEASNTYASETEARIAADDEATKHSCNTRVTATRMNARDGGRSVNSASATN